MATSRGTKPYIYVTWLTKILSGEAQCTWAAYFRAHFKYEKQRTGGEFNLAVWSADHAALLGQRAAALRADGYRIQLEGQNSFKWEGSTAILAGKPDLVAIHPEGHVLVSDAKTGKERGADIQQLFLYFLALPRTHRYLDGLNFSGEVVYRDHVQPVPFESLTAERRDHIFTTIRQVAATTPPGRVPSASECAWCDIPDSECPDRVHEAAPVLDAAAEF